MGKEISYDLKVDDAEKKILALLISSGLTITTISLLLDKIKNNIDIQKNETIKQLRILSEDKSKELG